MELEIIEFYLIEQNEEKGSLTGTLRIKLPELGIDILGIWVSKRKNSWYFRMPGGKGINHETDEPVWYPFIAFEDRDKQLEFIKAVREKGIAFIEKRLADTDNSLVISKQSDNGSLDSKATSMPKAFMKEWRDPPPRRENLRQANKFSGIFK